MSEQSLNIESWARQQCEIAYILLAAQGWQKPNFNDAIVVYEQVLSVYSPQIPPKWWIEALINLATSYIYCTRGEPTQNVERANALYKYALSLISAREFPEHWAKAQNGLGVTYRQRVSGNRASNLERAIQHYNESLKVFKRQTHRIDWARIQNNLTNVYHDRIRGKRSDNLEQAITCAKNALEVYASQPDKLAYAESLNNLANVYLERIKGDRADNVEQAIKHVQQALDSLPQQLYPQRWAEIQAHLADAYLDRIGGDHADNIEHAIELYELVLNTQTPQPNRHAWAHTRNGLGTAYQERVCGNIAHNQELAIENFEQALEVISTESDSKFWALIKNNLGNVYSTRYFDDRASNLERSIKHFQEALNVLSREDYPRIWAVINDNISNVYAQRIRGQKWRNIEQAIKHSERSLETINRRTHPVSWATAQNNLGRALGGRIRGEHSDNVVRAVECFKLASQVFSKLRLLAKVQEVQSNLGNLYFRDASWQDALRAFRKAINCEGKAYTEAGRQAEVEKTSTLYVCAAYCLLKLDRPGEALFQLEQGKTRLLSRALALDELDLSVLPKEQQMALRNLRQTVRSLEAEMLLPRDTPARRNDRSLVTVLERARAQLNDEIDLIRKSRPDFLPGALKLEDILANIPSGKVLVSPLITSHGSVIFIVPAGLQSVRMDNVLWLDNVKDSDVRAILIGKNGEKQFGGWLGAYFNAQEDEQAWHDTIDDIGHRLWEALFASLHKRLSTLDARHIMLMPQGGLGLLPLHAAWSEIGNKRQYLLDDYTVTYIPSIYALEISQQRLRDTQRQERSLLAVINPTKDLPFTPVEGEQIASVFGAKNALVLPEDKATQQAIMEAHAGYIHFACHGFYRWDDPMQSGLVLANKDPLTLAEIISQLDLHTSRLVTLSACETGITDIRQAPDEYLGLPAGFLQAGAPAVISTLWPVNDLSTMLLMEQFYRFHLQEKLDIPDALRQAQLWLRDVTAGELANRFTAEEEATLGATRMPIDTTSEYFARFTAQEPEQRPFAGPYYWAAFTFNGA